MLMNILQKFRTWYHIFFDHKKTLRREQLQFKDHVVQIKNENYFVAKAMVADIPDIVDAEKQIYNRADIWNSKAFEDEFSRDERDRLYLVIRNHDRLVAFIGGAFYDRKHECHITNLVVIPEFQNHGLGYFLMNNLITKARQMNFKRVTLEVRISNKKAQKLYEDLGFYSVSIKKHYYYSDHEDALNMSMNITKMDKSVDSFEA
ncbi:ribosomal-protein-alanine acetyltransferase [Philodulcilactobacillus myokoensis]|uniref:Ribosomal-protein-alanine acetyltransferase n=1 Tax=Philodulcilactobacillus myokoensis TaxID=2929573 RepID=A0A9W6ETC3_9LACO|nr:ribosomal protein S18-alanine N-acetyltransferase [Philodulcilactobacillus myokoensis]GLB47153.1 ribosomal-protein-alanine acetyltransferase [Philodulcilactobacillus myokoensis]